MLLNGLRLNPSSLYFAKVNKWKYPVSQEWLLLADFIDTFIAANNGSKKKAKSYPRPFKIGNTNFSGSKVSIEEARKLYKIKRRTQEEEEALKRNEGNKS